MANLKFRSSVIIRGEKEQAVLALRSGQIADEVAIEMGLLLYAPKDADAVWYYDHPTNEMAIRTMKKAYAAMGFKVKINLQDGVGRDIAKLLHPRASRYYSTAFNKTFSTGSGVQAPIAVDKMSLGIIAKNHPRLASSAILILIEDYDPEEMKEKIRKDSKRGEVWGFCQRVPKAENLHTGYDFKITMCKEIWERLDGPTKRYMLDHELMHCGRSAKGRWELWDHDVQCFTEEIARYGGRIKEVDSMIDGLVKVSGEAKKRRKKPRKRKA